MSRAAVRGRQRLAAGLGVLVGVLVWALSATDLGQGYELRTFDMRARSAHPGA